MLQGQLTRGRLSRRHGAQHEAVQALARCRDLFSAAVDQARQDAAWGGQPSFDDSVIFAALALSQAERRALLGLLGEARDLLIEVGVKKELLG